MEILMCVPTRNRAEMVEEVLEYEMGYYKRCKIRLRYYDSSDGKDTWNVIQKINKQYLANIEYRTGDPELCLDYKLIEILKEFEKETFEYLWLVNDSISIKEEMVELVCQAAEREYDLIRLPLAGEGVMDDIVAGDPNQWFHHCSQGMAHMASTVMRYTLVRQAKPEWEALREKYVGSNVLDENHGYFFMVAFYLEQILKLDSFTGIFLGNRVKWRRDSPLKGSQIYWRDHVFPAWAKSYPETLLQLPDYYTDKEEVIKRSDNLSPGRFSKAMLIHYRLRGLYNYSVYRKYRRYFPYVTQESLMRCLMIAVLPLFYLKKRYAGLYTVEECWKENLDSIELRMDEKAVLIYGAGLYGEKVIQKLRKDGYGDRITGVAVTNRKGNVEKLEGIAVRNIDYFIPERNDLLVIACALPAAAASMKKELKKRKFKYICGLFDG